MPQDYPIPRFHFQVDWGGSKISFTEVTGLVMEREKIEYRHSDSKDFNKIAMPGLVKNNNITLKRGKFESDFDFNDWLEAGGQRARRGPPRRHDPAAQREARTGRRVDRGALLPGEGHRARPEVRRQRGRHREPRDRPRGPEADEDLAEADGDRLLPAVGLLLQGGVRARAVSPNDARFQSVSGLSVEYDTEEYKEGGENRFTHKLPGAHQVRDLVLKRGMLTGSEVVTWFLDAFRDAGLPAARP